MKINFPEIPKQTDVAKQLAKNADKISEASHRSLREGEKEKERKETSRYWWMFVVAVAAVLIPLAQWYFSSTSQAELEDRIEKLETEVRQLREAQK